MIELCAKGSILMINNGDIYMFYCVISHLSRKFSNVACEKSLHTFSSSSESTSNTESLSLASSCDWVSFHIFTLCCRTVSTLFTVSFTSQLESGIFSDRERCLITNDWNTGTADEMLSSLMLTSSASDVTLLLSDSVCELSAIWTEQCDS